MSLTRMIPLDLAHIHWSFSVNEEEGEAGKEIREVSLFRDI